MARLASRRIQWKLDLRGKTQGHCLPSRWDGRLATVWRQESTGTNHA